MRSNLFSMYKVMHLEHAGKFAYKISSSTFMFIDLIKELSKLHLSTCINLHIQSNFIISN